MRPGKGPADASNNPSTIETYTYDKLDLASYQDRQQRVWTYAHDANRRLTSVTDPIGAQTQFGYNNDGKFTGLTDACTNVTQWTYDVQGRLTGKQYADTSYMSALPLKADIPSGVTPECAQSALGQMQAKGRHEYAWPR